MRVISLTTANNLINFIFNKQKKTFSSSMNRQKKNKIKFKHLIENS